MICLTFDTDYMSASDMDYFLKTLQLPGQGTFFITEPYRDLHWGNHERAPHPFFKTGEEWSTTTEKLTREMDNPPKGIRTHSCAYIQPFGSYLHQAGYDYISVVTLPGEENLKPYRHPWGIWEIPIYYMDNMDFCMSINWPDYQHDPFNPQIIQNAIHGNGLYVFDFHPLHLAMNTPTYAYYGEVREKRIQNQDSAFNYTFDGYGTRNFYLELCQAMQDNGLVSRTCSQALAFYQNKENALSHQTQQPLLVTPS